MVCQFHLLLGILLTLDIISQKEVVMSRDENPLSFEEYQVGSRKTAVYPDMGNNLSYPTVGLIGELGEFCVKLKEVLLDKERVIDDGVRAGLLKELGDVLWYLAAVASELDLDLGKIAQENLDKVFSRQERDCLRGSGDNR